MHTPMTQLKDIQGTKNFIQVRQATEQDIFVHEELCALCIGKWCIFNTVETDGKTEHECLLVCHDIQEALSMHYVLSNTEEEL